MKAVADANRIGEIVGGKYRVVRFLAKGGMGVVYEAQHAVVRRRFAIKFLRRELADRRDILTRFQREAESAGALENENVAAVIDFGITDDGTPTSSWSTWSARAWRRFWNGKGACRCRAPPI
jgi:serine/threonine protein kinase